jgi:hypothetical protein
VTRRVALAALCPGAFKPPAGAAPDAIVKLEFAGVGRAPSPIELQTLVSDLSASGDSGQTLADSLCTSLFATSAFNYY